MPYCKLDEGLLFSTVWREPDYVVRVWLALLCLKGKTGEVRVALPALADISRVTREQCEESLARFEAPDTDSRTQEFQGRRIERIEGGWYVLNHEKYRQLDDEQDRREKDAARQRRHRARNAVSRPVTPPNEKSRQAEADAEAEATDTTHTLAQKFAFADHQNAYLALRAVAPNAVAFDAMLGSVHVPTTGGQAFDWPLVGQALLELQSNGSRITAQGIRAFCRKLSEPEPSNGHKLTRTERGREALARTLTKHGYANGKSTDDQPLPRPLPRALPYNGVDGSDL